MNTKEKDTFVKEIHKYATVSEVFMHLVEVLWKNAIMELLIRAKIQEEVRKPDSVANYYDLLWKETEKMLESISIETNIYSVETNIYKNLFDEAKKAFILTNDDKA